ncbi:NRDE-2, necessary for RNA interference-domain-containing protein [Lasiosphaeria miniovina]|uniref:NRDE-2, necessary for RNA interference-domain-containing protein n=1 Tax=Lasiosphaeria miniovina TaxID=1954250 RepID=A0AA40DR69_9PEZI|nr:NRDE-2, necessary for RNA interference-domain-containing protein [Lasiosphaeria miniovina]KAK0709023.1 NRDE-2, necessary for RNA interference-domain-containing protein [Lasiosphaeria miniovina]
MSSRDDKRRTVPKFASFKPKQSPPPAQEPPTKSPSEAARTTARETARPIRSIDDAPRTADKSKSSRRHDADLDRRRDQNRDRGRDRDRHGQASLAASPAPAKETPGGSDIFFFDNAGDRLILKYGSNDRSKVPLYRRFGRGKLMGSSGLLAINRDGPREEFTLRTYGGGSSAFRDKNLLAKARQSKSKRIRPTAKDAIPTGSEDFVALEPPRKRRRGEDRLDSPPGAGMPDYRSIYSKAKTGSHPERDSDSDSASDSGGDVSSSPEAEDDSEMTTAKKRSIELSRRVRDDPSDIEAWLDMVKLQDRLFRESGGDYHQRSPDEVKGLAALKLSLYEEALPHAVLSLDRERILEGIMHEGSRVWEPRVLRKRWDEVTKSDGRSFVLWNSRLNYELTQISTFTYGDVKTLIIERLQTLNESLSKADLARESLSLSSQLVYVFLRLTRFLHDSGRSELAVAAWQAALEIAFCRPVEDDDESVMSSFADFWESEVPRLGEDCANGWRHFAESATMADPPGPRPIVPRDPPQTRDAFKAWALIEQKEMKRSCMPARTLDEGTEDDPFRVVTFSDIKDLLVWLPASASRQVKLQLLDAFLVFCRLPPACLSNTPASAILNDPFVIGRGQAFEASFEKETASISPDLSRKPPEFRQQGSSMALSPEALFPGAAWFRYLDKWPDVHKQRADQVDCSWVLGTLRFLVRIMGVEELAEYYLAMEWLNEPGGAKKVAKGLLKRYSSNLKLYNAYALIEWANKNDEMSTKVLVSVTNQNLSSIPSASQLLWNTWTWICLESGQKQLALARLCSSVDASVGNSATSPALLLKARSHFSSIRDYSLSSLQLETSAQYAESLALLEYLTAEGGSEPGSETQGNITAALASINSFSAELAARDMGKSAHHERLLQTAARLLYYHATHGPYRPVYVRKQLLEFIKLFPQNTIFLELFAWAESSLRLNDPVREVLQSVALAEPNDGVSTRRFAIQHEARVGTVHSTRAAFEAALEGSGGSACRGNVELWLGYLRFAAHSAAVSKELKAGQAKAVFYRAIAACPWAKELYLEAFGPALAADMSSAELRGVFSTMAVKGLRTHVDLEEFWDQWQRRKAERR